MSATSFHVAWNWLKGLVAEHGGDMSCETARGIVEELAEQFGVECESCVSEVSQSGPEEPVVREVVVDVPVPAEPRRVTAGEMNRIAQAAADVHYINAPDALVGYPAQPVLDYMQGVLEGIGFEVEQAEPELPKCGHWLHGALATDYTAEERTAAARTLGGQTWADWMHYYDTSTCPSCGQELPKGEQA